MAQVYPFRAFRYNAAHVSLDRVLTQPYDKISPAMQDRYYAEDPHNLIAVEKGRVHPDDTTQHNVYTRAAATLQTWINANIVVQDPSPSFYAYTQEYTAPGTEERRTRRGFIGAGKLEEYSAGVIFRHEQTLSGPKADRLELLRHTHMHTGQLFMLYSDEQRRVDGILAEVEASFAPAGEMRDEYNVLHRLWVVSEPERIAAIQEAMARQKLVIADGHHRYETALNFRDECRERVGATHIDEASHGEVSTQHATGVVAVAELAPWELAMMTFVNTRSEGLTILPTHRLATNLDDFSWSSVRRYLEPWFVAETFPFADDAAKPEARTKFLTRLAEARQQRAIGVYPTAEPHKRAFYLLTVRPGVDLSLLLPNVSPMERELDVVLLHDGILEPTLGITPQAVTAEQNLRYEREALSAIDAVDGGAAQVAFLLNPCDVEQVMQTATSGEVLPQKSTDFYPKLLSGITMYRVEG